MSHTPGPSPRADIRVGCAVVYVGEKTGGCIENGRKRLAYFQGVRAYNPDGSFKEWTVSEEDVANARLIAAAPDFQAMALNLERWWRLPNAERTIEAIEPVICEAIAALAKAEERK